MGNGTVAKLHTLTRNDTAATRLDCRWDDGVAYNTSTAPVSGNVLLQVRLAPPANMVWCLLRPAGKTHAGVFQSCMLGSALASSSLQN